MQEPPLVSCLCVTRDRVSLLRRAVSCFLGQTYQPRELVVVYEADDPATREYLNALDEPAVRGVEVPAQPRQPLGSLRNVSLQAAHGRYVAQWDDDDWHAPTRLADQMRVIGLVGRPACVLTRWTFFDATTRMAYISGKRTWEGSLVAERSAMPAYVHSGRGEDSPVIEAMLVAEQLAFLDDPNLYVYIYHGGNTWDRSHWDNLVKSALPLPQDVAERVGRLVAAGE